MKTIKLILDIILFPFRMVFYSLALIGIFSFIMLVKVLEFVFGEEEY